MTQSAKLDSSDNNHHFLNKCAHIHNMAYYMNQVKVQIPNNPGAFHI